MEQESNKVDIFRSVGLAVGASQIFEVVFVLAARFALKQPNITVFKDIEYTAFKRPIKAILQELSQAASIPDDLANRIETLIDNRHKIVHRAFLENGWPATLTEEKEKQFFHLCINVINESQLLSNELIPILLAWMERFPETAETSNEYTEKFIELSNRVKAQGDVVQHFLKET